jgi:hypothetical protein
MNKRMQMDFVLWNVNFLRVVSTYFNRKSFFSGFLFAMFLDKKKEQENIRFFVSKKDRKMQVSHFFASESIQKMN